VHLVGFIIRNLTCAARSHERQGSTMLCPRTSQTHTAHTPPTLVPNAVTSTVTPLAATTAALYSGGHGFDLWPAERQS